MAFRKKAKHILVFNPDLLIIPECEHPSKLIFSKGTPKPTDILWFGKNQNKGIGIFSYGSYRLSVLDCYNEDFQLVIPIKVSYGKDEFNLFAIWANNPDDSDGQYIEQIWKAVHYYNHILKDSNTILTGDFNSNKIWDKKHKESNHSNVVEFLEYKGIFSTYHMHFKQTQGSEEHSTLYMYRHRDKSYHIDYCFASKDFLSKLRSVEVGSFDEWTLHSDHVPLVVTFDS